jgi:hypothetical protein
MGTQPYRPLPANPDALPGGFPRGRRKPRGVAWFGVRSFWGHLRHLVASAIATEDVDSRDWMWPDDPQELADRIAEQLGATRRGQSLCDNLGRDLWIDYVADTGDDSEVSEAVARLVFAPYELPEPDGGSVVAPVGDVLFFGGDTAYPVATGEEIHNRVIVPFNRVLETVPDDGRARVLLGIPGNHDWYDGLDGFGRMFRVKDDEEVEIRPSVVEIHRPKIEKYADWAREFVRGGHVEKPRALVLRGYTPVQRASYFCFPLTPTTDVYALDRQLGHIDRRQRHYFRACNVQSPRTARMLALPDPVFAFGEPSRTGTAMIEALGVDLAAEPHLVLSGDIHLYRRWRSGPTTHVIAGGGGAFLHPAPVARDGLLGADVEWPTPAQSARLLAWVPWTVMFGRSGFLPHLAYLALLFPAFVAAPRTPVWAAWPHALGAAIVSSFVYAMIRGRHHPFRYSVAFAAAAAGLCTGALALIGRGLAATLFDAGLPGFACTGLALSATLFGGALVFGSYLTIATLFGLELTQAFTALDHPGFKHFLRLRVRADGSQIDAWCIGIDSPLSADARAVIVDRVSWSARPTQSAAAQ